MKEMLRLGTPAISLLGIFFLSLPTYSTESASNAPGLSVSEMQTINGQLEPNYQTTSLTEVFPADYISINPNAAIDLSGDARKTIDIGGLTGGKARKAGAVTTLSTPPLYNINVNTTYTDVLTTASPASQYRFTISSTVKVTGLLGHNATTNSNIDLRLYRQDPTTSLYNLVAGSYYAGASAEQLSHIATSGTYILEAVAVGAVSGGSINIKVQTNTGYDSNEGDDNFWQAKPLGATVGVSGNLDHAYDRDFHTFTLSTATTINYSLTDGNNYEAKLYYDNGSLAFTLSSNVIASLSLPAGTYYWAINSPTGAGLVSAPYTFSAFRDVASIVVDYNSDEGNYRRDWGVGNYWSLSNTASFTGYAYDASGAPAAGSYIKFTNEGSVVGLQATTTIKTDSTGFFSATVSSPSGAGAHSFTGACLRYYYDVHTMKIQRYYGGTIAHNIGTIAIKEGLNQILMFNSQVLLNDIAYNIYIGC